MKKKEQNKGRILLISAGLLWGLAGLCVKSMTWSSLAINGVRSLISVILLLIVKKSVKLHWTKKNILGAVAETACAIFYMTATKMTTAGTAIVLQYIAPILIFLFEVLFRKKKPLLWQIILTAGVFLGIVLSFSDNLDMTHIFGNCFALLSGFAFATQILVMNGEDCNPEDCTIFGNIFSVLIGLPFLFFDGTATLTFTNLHWMLIMGVFQYGLANICFSKGCQKVESVECSILISVEPIFNPIMVAVFGNEIMGIRAIIGAAIVVVCVTLYSVIPEYLKRKRKLLGA